MIHIYEQDLCELCYQTDITYCDRKCVMLAACHNYEIANGEVPDSKVKKGKYKGDTPFRVWKNY